MKASNTVCTNFNEVTKLEFYHMILTNAIKNWVNVPIT